MAQVGGAFVRLRPTLSPEDAAALEELERIARTLADALERFRSQFVVPDGARAIGELPLRVVREGDDNPEGDR